ncbi:MAG: hypothetical protein OXU45_02905 [Candidatus Melainabacteria bacterium]|nr:hypothetical protein [Candidatus Melainabacteria bacterium]
MKQKTVYLLYGLALMILGLIGFYLTHSKTALYSSLPAAVIIIALSFFTGNTAVLLITRVVNLALIGAFAWRANIAISAISNGGEYALTKGILIPLMALVSVGALAISLLAPKYPEDLSS